MGHLSMSAEHIVRASRRAELTGFAVLEPASWYDWSMGIQPHNELDTGTGTPSWTARDKRSMELLARVEFRGADRPPGLSPDAADTFSLLGSRKFGSWRHPQTFLLKTAAKYNLGTEHGNVSALRELQAAGMISVQFFYLPTDDGRDLDCVAEFAGAGAARDGKGEREDAAS